MSEIIKGSHMFENQEAADIHKDKTLQLFKECSKTLSSQGQRSSLSYARCLKDIELKGCFTADDLDKLAACMRKAEQL